MHSSCMIGSYRDAHSVCSQIHAPERTGPAGHLGGTLGGAWGSRSLGRAVAKAGQGLVARAVSDGRPSALSPAGGCVEAGGITVAGG